MTPPAIDNGAGGMFGWVRKLGSARSTGIAPAAAPRPALRRRQPRSSAQSRFASLCRRRGFGTALVLLLAASVTGFGLVRGGQYDALVAEAGSPANLLARSLGFGVAAITMTGQRELLNSEILDASGVTARDSVLFLDAAAVRKRLLALPLVREATVRKLYPNQVVIAIEERTPFALWQLDGEVLVISADGTSIDKMRDQSFARLPFVTGEGANLRVAEYIKIVEAAGDLRPRITAGILSGQRRWTLKLNNGVDIRLPEFEPEEAIARLARLNTQSKLADKDIVSIDMRVAGKLYIRLTEDAAARRMEAKSKKKPKGGAA